ncbi:serine/threonine-protein kinase [Nonomuraea sp. NPDC047897]|uniref:serine/threonine-protein kinase n=1 Tax=Nonomuraea sp. NPDC047897 TaxID=3364346 RepID=UPI00371DB322
MIAGRYRLDERIGSGPMGEVWRAYDTRADWTVAVRVLGAGAAREVLERHAQAVARVIHPNVAMVLDVGDENGTPYLVTEFLTGESLEEEAARGPLPVVEACDLVGQAAAGLDAAHRAGVAHGEVEPGSFRRAGSGVLKVSGFGPAGRPPSPGRIAYTAPERLDGRAAEAPADMYALGCVCYELLCGRPPFQGTPEEIAAAHRDAEPEPPSRHRREVPADLDRLVLALLAKDPATRPSNGESVRRTLAAIARPRPASPSPQGPVAAVPVTGAMAAQGGQAGAAPRAGDTAVFDLPPDGPDPGSNRRLFLQLGAALAVIAAVTVGLVLWGGSRGEQAAAPTPSSTPPSFTPSSTPASSPSSPPSTPSSSPEPTALAETSAPPPKATLGDSVPRGGWETWLRAFDDNVTTAETMGTIEPRTAAKAHDKIREAARKFLKGEDEAGRDQIRHVLRDLERGQRKGEVPTTGPLADFMRDWRL